LTDHLLLPLEDFDGERAAALCAEVCRQAFEHLAPALILIRSSERRHIQARGAYLLALFDFASQPGMEGERLSQINRWEFNLDQTLAGNPIGQPIFVHLAKCYAAKPWNDMYFGRLVALARHQAASEKGLVGVALDRWFTELGGALREQFLGEDAPIELDGVFSAIARAQRIKTRVLLQLRHRKAENPVEFRPGFGSDVSTLGDEIDALQRDLEAGRYLIKLVPHSHRRALSYTVRASHAILNRCRAALSTSDALLLQLGIFARLHLLLACSLRP
jgi:hypothetical protein